MSETQQTTQLTSVEQVKQRISELHTALTSRLPGYEGLLQIIHRNLANDPDVVTLLSKEEVGTVVAALSQRKGIVLAKAAGSGKTSSGKKLSQITTDDL